MCPLQEMLVYGFLDGSGVEEEMLVYGFLDGSGVEDACKEIRLKLCFS
jgi:hypothetical protein